MFSGLKKFISSYPQLFYFEENNNFNPKVYMHLSECAPEATALGSIPTSLPRGSPSQQMDHRPMAVIQGALLPPPMKGMHEISYPLPKVQPIWENCPWGQQRGPGSVMNRPQNNFNHQDNMEAGHTGYFADERYNPSGDQKSHYFSPSSQSHQTPTDSLPATQSFHCQPFPSPATDMDSHVLSNQYNYPIRESHHLPEQRYAPRIFN